MKLSENWLRTFCNPALDGPALEHLLTMAGFEVEDASPAAPPFDKVVVAQVLDVARHPDADRLSVCRVDAGTGEPLAIVCGAPNVRAGMKAPCALVGAKLPGITIRKAKVRGVESQGMLCARDELGLGEDHSGLLELPADAPVGADFRAYADLDDRVLDLKLTPNRADCLGMVGIAREVSALTGAPLGRPQVDAAPVSIDDRIAVRVHAPDLCGRFSGRVVRGVNAKAATPEWMKRRLERGGQRSISALVDISNYVMLELNRPNHVFDLARIHGGLDVRWARAGESLKLLNGETIELATDVGVIAGEAGVESLAGIMGGDSTAVSLDTTDVYVEAAFWWPDSIQGRSRRYGFSSEAAYRFERGVDYADTVEGVERVTQLILEICGGRAGPVDDQVVRLPERRPVRLRPQRAARVLGVPCDRAEAAMLVARMGFACADDGDALLVTPPSHRFDIAIEEDLIEEIARLKGYEAIPAAAPVGTTVMLPRPEATLPASRIRALLAARDYQEVVTYAFVDADWERDFCGNENPVELANPIASQMSVMRTSLVGGLVDALRANLSHRQARVRLFEIGRCFLPRDGAIEQPVVLAGLCHGDAAPEQWGLRPPRSVDFYDVKADLEALCGAGLEFSVAQHPALHPGRSAVISNGVEKVGFIGELHPKWREKYEIAKPVVVFELALSAIQARSVPAYAPISKFPLVRRDLAVEVDAGVPVDRLLAGMRAGNAPFVTDIHLFDVYSGPGMAAGKKSLAFRVLLQDTQKTLTDDEVNASVDRLVELLEQQFHAKLRK